MGIGECIVAISYILIPCSLMGVGCMESVTIKKGVTNERPNQ